MYADESGRPLGDGIGYLRDLIIADTDEEARQLWAQSSGFVGGAWFAPFGFDKGMVDPDTGKMLSVDEMFDQGLVLAGTVDTVKRQLEKMRERQPVNWVFAWMYNGVLENSVLMNTIEKFGREIQTN